MVGDDSRQIPDLGLLRRLGNCTVLNQHFPNPKSNKNPKIFSEKNRNLIRQERPGGFGLGLGLGQRKEGKRTEGSEVTLSVLFVF